MIGQSAVGRAALFAAVALDNSIDSHNSSSICQGTTLFGATAM